MGDTQADFFLSKSFGVVTLISSLDAKSTKGTEDVQDVK